MAPSKPTASSPSRRGRARRALLAAHALGVLLWAAAPSFGAVATALLKEDGPLPGAPVGHTISSLNNTAVNQVGGYAVSVNSVLGASTLSHIWGHATGGGGTVIRTEGTYGPLVQTAFESFYGFADGGEVAYSATGTGGPVGAFDSAWLDDVPVAVEGNPIPSLPGLFWRFASRPGVTADANPYWVGGTTNVPGGATQNYGLFYGMGATVLLLGGTTVPGLPFALGTSSSIGFDYRISALGSHHIVPVVILSGSSATNDAVVVDSSGLMISGGLVREGSPVPAAAGGLPAENWLAFDFMGIAESGDYFFTGNTNAVAATNEIVVKNGVIIHREGQVLDGRILTGDIEGGYMNESGDIALTWDVTDETALEALFVNDELVLLEKDLVDLSGDGVAEANARLADFTGITALTLSERDVNGYVNAYFTADIDTLGTVTANDDIEGFFCLRVLVQAPTAVTGISAFYATPRPDGVEVEWLVRARGEYLGFYVLRSEGSGAFERQNVEMIPSAADVFPATFRWIDDTAREGATYSYKIEVVHPDGLPEVWEESIQATRSSSFALRLAGPNPVGPGAAAEFEYQIPTPGAIVSLGIYDASGRRVATLLDGRAAPGVHRAAWNGSREDGIGSGVYFLRMEAGAFHATQRIVLLK